MITPLYSCKWRPGEIQYLARGHLAREMDSWDLDLATCS